ncbi:MAG TPA: SIS domain-containing protein [Cyclobacteriaceae bacterium]|jgi:D-sedoheptulose 7-phosphate isomerase|nr:SIS domain-containing protein [Cyclobacteriaceae bacterium]
MKKEILHELMSSARLLNKFIADSTNIKAIENAAMLMASSIKKGNKIITCGNGGSMSDAMHFASELTGRYKDDRKPIPAIAISDPGHLSCVANDYGYHRVFSRWIEAHGRPEDVLVAISTSGNSENVFAAVQTAIQKNMYVVFLSGNDGGTIQDLLGPADVEIRVPHEGYAGPIQGIHIQIIHILCGLIEKMV